MVKEIEGMVRVDLVDPATGRVSHALVPETVLNAAALLSHYLQQHREVETICGIGLKR